MIILIQYQGLVYLQAVKSVFNVSPESFSPHEVSRDSSSFSGARNAGDAIHPASHAWPSRLSVHSAARFPPHAVLRPSH